MKLIIEGDYRLITDQVRQLAQTHLGQKIDQYLKNFDQAQRVARLKITKGDRWGFRVSLKMILPRNKEIFADSKNKQLLSALISVRDQAIKQIKTYKEKMAGK